MNVLQSRSKLTDRYQTTIPAEIRQVLGLGKRDDVGYIVDQRGQVRLVNSSAAALDEDPALAPFLALIDKDLATHPGQVTPYSAKQASADRAFLERRKKSRGA